MSCFVGQITLFIDITQEKTDFFIFLLTRIINLRQKIFDIEFDIFKFKGS